MDNIKNNGIFIEGILKDQKTIKADDGKEIVVVTLADDNGNEHDLSFSPRIWDERTSFTENEKLISIEEAKLKNLEDRKGPIFIVKEINDDNILCVCLELIKSGVTEEELNALPSLEEYLGMDISKLKVKDALLSENYINSLISEINQLSNKNQYRLEIGQVLYSNGIKVNDYIATIYNIVIDEYSSFTCNISICYGDEIQSTDYNSKYEPKTPIPIMNGYIYTIRGHFDENEKVIVERKDLLKWPRNYFLQELKSLVRWPDAPVYYKGETVPLHLNEQPHNLKNERFMYYSGISFIKKKFVKEKKRIQISNLGRIKMDDVIIKQEYDPEKGLLYIPDFIYSHRMMAEFLEKPNRPFGLAIHHIDNNGYNNNIRNLVNITEEQHASIHPWMWENYYLEDDMLKNYKDDKLFNQILKDADEIFRNQTDVMI